jgi:hypothetical protein
VHATADFLSPAVFPFFNNIGKFCIIAERPVNKGFAMLQISGAKLIHQGLHRVNYFCRLRRLFLPVAARLIGRVVALLASPD